MQKHHPDNFSDFAVVQLLVSKETCGSLSIILTWWLQTQMQKQMYHVSFGLPLPSTSPAAFNCIGSLNADTENYSNRTVPSFSPCPKIAVGNLCLLELGFHTFPLVLLFLSKWCHMGLAVWKKRHSKPKFMWTLYLHQPNVHFWCLWINFQHVCLMTSLGACRKMTWKWNICKEADAGKRKHYNEM